jgi:predicted porin
MGALGTLLVVSTAHSQDKPDVQALKRVIENQQTQLNALQKQLEAQGRLLQQLLAKEASPTAPALPAAPAETENKPQVAAQTIARAPEKKVVTSGGGEKVKLAISGQINRMISIIDDGKDTDAYFVDNDNSESQFRLVATAEVSDDLTLGGTLEVSIAPNKSGSLDQQNQEENNIFDQRKAEVSLDSKRWGKLWLGKGNTASYTAGAVDLSGTGVISYSTIVDTAGSMIFRESDSGDFSDVRIFQAFNSFDGLSRQNRLRYDSPEFGGLRFAASAVSDARHDASVWWGGQGHGLKAAGAVGIADPNLDDADLQYNGSFAVLHETSGLNAAVSFGYLERDDQDDQENYFAKLGWITNFFSFGDTAFSVDYTRSLNLPTDSDDGNSYAVAAVQQFDDYGVELYALFRRHSLDLESAPSVDDIDVFTVGTRVKF